MGKCAVLPADHRPDAVPVRSFRPRMACTACGIIGADEAGLAGDAGERELAGRDDLTVR
jgi:hypothetical protein